MYFLAENVALLYTTASNASLLVAINPFFTGLLFAFVYGKKLSRFFIIGFFVSFVGIFLVIFQDELNLQIYPIGDLLCILAGIIWSVYTLVLEMIFARFKGISHLVILKRIFFMGCFSLCLLPCINQVFCCGLFSLYKIPRVILK